MMKTTMYIDELFPAPHLDVLSYGRSRDRLVASVRKAGVVDPPVVSRRDGAPLLVTGKARIDALRILGQKSVQVVVRDDLDLRRAFELALEENLKRRGFNPVERAAGARYVLADLAPPREDVERLLALLGVPRNPRSLSHHLALSRASGRIRSMVAGGRLTCHSFVLTAGLARIDRDALIDVIERLRLGHGYQRELIALTTDIAATRGECVAGVLSAEGLSAVIEDGILTVPDRVKRIFARLRLLRHRAATPVSDAPAEAS